MDYLKAERERGITINSAAITFGWQGHRINLIDTPGHVDFTMEVERSMRVLDGAVTILDGVAGVEAQTETVWHQADRYTIPRIAFVNKMDRTGAAFGRTVQEMWRKLQTRPLVLQLPIQSEEGIRGVADLVTMESLFWKDTDGMEIVKEPLQEGTDLHAEAVRGRIALVETLAELDDAIVEVFFEKAEGDHMRVPQDAIKAALRRATLNSSAVPVLCGAAFKNMGVQPVLDAIIDYLPSPLDRPAALAKYRGRKDELIPLTTNGKLCALAFKVTHDARRGPLVYCKVYSGKPLKGQVCLGSHFHSPLSGTLGSRMTLYNTASDKKERINRLLQMYAKDVEEIPTITAGNIGVIVGLKHTRTGDTLVQANDAAAIKSGMQLSNIDIPSPAFFTAIEPHSVSEEKHVAESLESLCREDPSLNVWTDEDSGQMLISGMGELHLEIVKDRLLNEFKCKADMGKMRISYRESCQTSAAANASYDKEILGKRARASCRVEIEPYSEADDDGEWIVEAGGNRLWVDPSDLPEDAGLDADEVRRAMQVGIQSGLARGAILGFPLTQVKVKASQLKTFGQESTLGAISASVASGVFEAVKQASPCLLEPMMEVHAQIQEKHIGSVVGDLSGTRRGHVLSLESTAADVETDDVRDVYIPKDALLSQTSIEGYAPKQIVKAHVPLSAMLGYSSALRSLTAGSGSFSMRVIGYGGMNKDREDAVVKEMRGF